MFSKYIVVVVNTVVIFAIYLMTRHTIADFANKQIAIERLTRDNNNHTHPFILACPFPPIK